MNALGYPGGMGKQGRANRQRRPTGTFWVVTDDLVEAVEAAIKAGDEQKKMAARLSKKLGYVVDPSSISNIARRVHPTSVLARALAEDLGCALPPPAIDDERLARVLGVYSKLMALDPGRFDDAEEYAAAELRQAEKFAKSSRGTPGESED